MQDDIWKDRSKLDRKIGGIFYMKRVYLVLILTALPCFGRIETAEFFLGRDGVAAQYHCIDLGVDRAECTGEIVLCWRRPWDKSGSKWRLENSMLKSLEANAKGSQLVVEAAGSKKVIKDVLVGEVWLASGQSNMEWRVSGSANAKEEVAKANDPLLRVFVSANVAENRPQRNWRGKLEENSTAGYWIIYGGWLLFCQEASRGTRGAGWSNRVRLGREAGSGFYE